MSSRIALAALAAVLLPAATCEEDVGEGDTVSVVTVRVSVLPQDFEANGSSSHASISGDGRFVAFASDATNLTDGDSNGLRDIFVKDRKTGAVENLTNIVGIGLTTADCDFPVISSDGRFVAFTTSGNLLADPNFPLPPAPPALPPQFIYVFDRVQRVFRAVTEWPTAWPDDETLMPSLSADGRYLAFATAATNLSVATGGLGQIIVCDFGVDYSSRTLTLVTQALGQPAGTPSTGISIFPSISGDGSRVAFTSFSTDLDAADAHSGGDVYLWTAPSTIALASVQNPSSAQFLNVFGVLSQDGNWIAYRHQDTGLGNPTPRSIRRYSVSGGTTQMVSDPGHSIGTFDIPTLSGDGQRVAYCGFIPGPAPVAQIYLFRQGAAGVTQASVSSFGVSGSQNSVNPAFAADGRWLAWESATSELVDDDTNGASDIFIRGPLR